MVTAPRQSMNARRNMITEPGAVATGSHDRQSLDRSSPSLPLRLLYACVLLLVSTSAFAQIETGKFRLHKFEQPIGEETYTIARENSGVIVTSDFKFTDRGTEVPLTAELHTQQDLTPISFRISGKVSRLSTIDSSIEINGNSASIREGTKTRQATVTKNFFTIAGYAPTIMQMMLVRYIQGHKLTSSVATLPNGDVTVEHRGKDKVKVGDKEI